MPAKLESVTNGSSVNPATSLTYSFTMPAVFGGILLVAVRANTVSDYITGVTYAGTAMTLVGKIQIPAYRWMYLYSLINPASGANNVIVSASSSTYIGSTPMAYSGARQTNNPDVSQTGTSSASTTCNISLTTLVANSLVVGTIEASTTGIDANSGTIRVDNKTTSPCSVWNKSAITVSPASATISVESEAANHIPQTFGGIIASIAGTDMTLGEYLGAGSATTKLLLHLNGNSTDSSGNGNNGTDTAITYVDGKFGKCSSFNGSSSVIKIADHSSLDITGSMTVSTWVYLPNQIGTNVNWAFVGKTAGGSNRSWWMDYEDAAGAKTLRLNLSANGTAVTIKSVSYTFPTNSWVNVIAVYDTSAATTKFYINGNQQGATQTSSAASIFNSTAKLEVGAIHDGAIYFLAGSEDEIIIENIAWTPQQVAKYYSYAKGYYATL